MDLASVLEPKRVSFGDKVSFIWSVADLIRDGFERGKYQDVILPFTVLRRLDLVLAPTKATVLEAYRRYKDQLENLDPVLRRASGFAFYNTFSSVSSPTPLTSASTSGAT
jgi:type I restriction enzyme M protein